MVFEPNGHDERTSDTDRRGGIMGSGGAASGPTTTVIVPADLRYLEVIRCSVRIALEGSGCDAGCTSDLQLACDEIGGMLITSARTPGDLQLAVTEDGVDAYVRMTVPVAASGFRPPVPDLTLMLLDATADSYEVRTDGEALIGVIQREIACSPHPSS